MKTGRGGSLTHKQDQLMVPQVTLVQWEMLLEILFIVDKIVDSLISVLRAMTNPIFFFLQRQKNETGSELAVSHDVFIVFACLYQRNRTPHCGPGRQ